MDNKDNADLPYEKIAILDNSFESQLLSSILTEMGIPHRLKSYYDTAYDGLFQAQKGWGAVYGPNEKSDDIKKVLNDIRIAPITDLEKDAGEESDSDDAE